VAVGSHSEKACEVEKNLLVARAKVREPRAGQLLPRASKERPDMKATPAVARKTGSKQAVPRTGSPDQDQQEPQVESLRLSPDELKDRAFTSTQVMAEILAHNKRSSSFRHWGINE
jgi:hypothetical protein